RFRGAPMTDGQHMAFTRQFGELEFNPAKLIEKQYGVSTQTAGRNSEIPPEISVISNIIEDGKAIGGLGDGEAFWHTDSSFVDVPPAASLLRSLECPPPSAGGAERSTARRIMGPHGPGEVHLDPGMANRRPRLVGQSLRDAPPRRLRPRHPPPDAPHPAEGHKADLGSLPLTLPRLRRGSPP